MAAPSSVQVPTFTRSPLILIAPCHGKVATGGPSMLWCPECGRGFQADDPRLRAAQARL